MGKRRIRPLALAVMFMSAVLLAGCSSSRKAVAPVASEQKISTASDMRVGVRALISRYGNWERLRVPVTVNLSSPKKVSISGTAIMERGKSIMISLKFWGMEIGNLYMTNDSVTVIDKVHKCYASESIGNMLAGFDVNVSNVQDLLLGRLFQLGADDVAAETYRNAEMEIVSDNSWILVPDNSKDRINYGFSFSPADVLNALIVQSGKHQPVSVMYSPAVPTACGMFSPAVAVSYSTGKTILDANLSWDLGRARWNSDVDLRVPSVNSNYKRIPSADIPKIISKL